MSKPPLAAAGLDLIDVADEDGGEEAAGLQPRGALEDAGVRALGVDYLAGILFEYFNKVLKHFATASILIWRTLRRFSDTQFYHPIHSFSSPGRVFTRGQRAVIILIVIKYEILGRR